MCVTFLNNFFEQFHGNFNHVTSGPRLQELYCNFHHNIFSVYKVRCDVFGYKFTAGSRDQTIKRDTQFSRLHGRLLLIRDKLRAVSLKPLRAERSALFMTEIRVFVTDHPVCTGTI